VLQFSFFFCGDKIQQIYNTISSSKSQASAHKNKSLPRAGEKKGYKCDGAFVLRENETREFDAEGVIDQSSPYKGTAERSSATKKPHKK